ncbi:MAG: hypothetical protein WAX69_03060 [Victivallales bacterium]
MAAARKKHVYSLIEILLVIGIMVILFSLAVPEFVKTLKGQGAEFAARTLSVKLNLARSYAISKRKYVAILMPQSGGAPSASNIPDKYFHCSYRACIVAKNGSNYYFQQWIQGESWEFLPEGVSIAEIDDDNGVNVSGGYLSPSNGAITTVSPSPLPGTSPNKGVDCSDIGGLSDVTDFGAVIFKPNGISATSTSKDTFIEICEGKYVSSAGNVVITNKNSNSYVSLKIDSTTGRISYGNK